MNVTHLSASLSRSAGGIFEIELALARALHDAGIQSIALGLDSSEWMADRERWAPVPASVHSVKGPRAYGYSPMLRMAVFAQNSDLMHLHSMWMYPSVIISRWGKMTGKPYIVTPNGMLEPWALSNSAWKKKLAGYFYENRMLLGAACLHANTEKELQDVRSYGLKNPVCIIPNGVDLPVEESEGQKVEGRRSGERKMLLFLGRMHPKKGLVNALRAWNEIRSQKSEARGQDEWQFVIAGWDQGGHEAELKRLCKEIGLAYAETPAASFLAENCKLKTENSQIVFVGPAFGQEKDLLLRSASAFILPSFSEGLPMSVLEAWSYRLPVLMTDHCNLPEGFAHNAAIHIGTDVESIAEGLHQLLQSPIPDLQSIGQNGRSLVERQFTWPQVAAQMKEVYAWILDGGEAPACVRQC